MLQKSLETSIIEKTKEAQLHEYFANHDPLTGLANRRFAEKNLKCSLKKAKSEGLSMVLMYLDLNGFKRVNDIYGHHAGDMVLKVVAERLRSCTRKQDKLMRFGGDEFAVSMVVDNDETDIIGIIQKKIREGIAKPIMFEGQKLRVTTSIGVASYPHDGDQVRLLMALADKEMYIEKLRFKEQKNNTIQNNETASISVV